jgi:PilZ domain
MQETDLQRPEENSAADVTLVTRGLTVTACVEISAESGIVVRPTGAGSEWLSIVGPGDAVELYWVSGYEERTLPARITQIESGLETRWALAPTGPAQRSQRRKAVRAVIALPVVMPWAGASITGTTVDLSEGGLKALVDGWGLPPESGSRTTLTLTLDDGVLDLPGEVVWHADRGAQWLIAVKFHELPERTGDRLRRRVFQALREERSRTNA